MQLNFPDATAKISMFNLNLIIGGVIAVLIAERGTKKVAIYKKIFNNHRFDMLFFTNIMGLIISSPLYLTTLTLDELTLKEHTFITATLIIEIGVAVYLLIFLMWIINKSRQ